MCGENQRNRSRLAEHGHAPQHEAHPDRSGHNERARTDLVVKATDKRTGNTHEQASGQQHESGVERAEQQDVLHVDRQQDDGAEKRRHNDDHEHN